MFWNAFEGFSLTFWVRTRKPKISFLGVRTQPGNHLLQHELNTIVKRSLSPLLTSLVAKQHLFCMSNSRMGSPIHFNLLGPDSEVRKAAEEPLEACKDVILKENRGKRPDSRLLKTTVKHGFSTSLNE